jgi:two-component system, sensor histidine kinase and response regulator
VASERPSQKLNSTETETRRATTTAKEQEEQRVKVLMVEDDEIYHAFVHRLLIRSIEPKFEVAEARTLAETTHYLSWEAPDVILLDLSLPDSKGLITLKRVQELANEVPIIILTGVDDEDTGLDAVRLGAQDYLVKHAIGDDSISRCIRYAIERRRFEESTLRLAAIRDFAAMLAHDLKTPLIGASNVFDALQAGQFGELSSELEKIVSDLKNSNSDQLQLVQKLLEVYRYEAGASILDIRAIDIKSLIEKCAQDVSHHYGSSIPIMLDLAEELTAVDGDQDALRRLFTNLLDNAVKFSDGSGPVSVGSERSGTKLSVRVHNFGKPISREVRTNLFHRFWQGLPGKSYVAHTGLGLYLCHRIATMHYGRITCQSTVEDGTTIRVILPVTLPR